MKVIVTQKYVKAATCRYRGHLKSKEKCIHAVSRLQAFKIKRGMEKAKYWVIISHHKLFICINTLLSYFVCLTHSPTWKSTALKLTHHLPQYIKKCSSWKHPGGFFFLPSYKHNHMEDLQLVQVKSFLLHPHTEVNHCEVSQKSIICKVDLLRQALLMTPQAPFSSVYSTASASCDCFDSLRKSLCLLLSVGDVLGHLRQKNSQFLWLLLEVTSSFDY